MARGDGVMPMPDSNAGGPVLEGQALAAVEHRGSHVQIIASAGSGKTEVVAQRVASLLAEGVPAEAIVAFTFTERAANELKNRITHRVAGRLGAAVVDHLGALFVGTIHAYCFRLLQQRVPRYETYDVLDDNQLTAFLSREAAHLGLKTLDADQKVFRAISAFLRSVDVIENDLLDPASMPEPFGPILREYYETLDRYRLLTYGQQIVRAVKELEEHAALRESTHATLRHLIVDEYQDINPAQERLISLLTGPSTELCVVGDDQQAVYQWRGSDVSNIITFRDRYPAVATFEITTNRRSRPQIIDTANGFAQSIPNRIDKTMQRHRPPDGSGLPEVVVWSAPTEVEEAGWITDLIDRLATGGARYRDIAVLVRSRAAYKRLVEQFATFDIPVQPGGRSGLFDQPEARLLGRTLAWLADEQWRDPYQPGRPVSDDVLISEYEQVFEISPRAKRELTRVLHDWKRTAPREHRSADLVGELYDLLDVLDVRSWDLKNRLIVNRLGTLARFSSLLADYESVRRRARPDADTPGEQVGGQDRGAWYYRNLARHVVNYAQGAYEGFDGEADYVLDAIDLTTVHRAKGLEWPVVFVPSVTINRFPTTRTGSVQDWLVPRDRFDANRYEGSDADERRLFYVALTRARDWLSVSRHEKTNVRAVGASPYWQELSHLKTEPGDIEVPSLEAVDADADDPIAITYSELASFLDCGMAFRLRTLIGFQPRLAQELGYGKAVHHIMRAVAEVTKATGHVPQPEEIDRMLDASFFLPTANKPAHRQLKEAARRLVTTYAERHEGDLHRVWETERPFELHLDGVTVSGRADVILDHESGVPTSLAIVDYKTRTSGDIHEHALQLQVYADAGRREGLDVQAAYVHDLNASDRIPIDVDAAAVSTAEATVNEATGRLRAREYRPNPGQRCARCEVRTICAYRKQ